MANKKSEKIEEVGLSGSRVKKLTISNFRCIGKVPVSIELEKIVVLVGPNNVGKSTILRAYEYVMDHKNITADDFPGGNFDPNNPPTIELETWLGEEKPGSEWLIKDDTGEAYIREKWTWGEDCRPIREGWNGGWSSQVPWGAPNVARARRPKPHRVEAFSTSEEQTTAVAKLLLEYIKERAQDGDDDSSPFGKIKKVYKEVHDELVQDTKERVSQVENAITSLLSNVFGGYKVQFEVSPNNNSDKVIDLLLTNPTIRMGPEGGYLADIEGQGSGARRTLLWAALKLLAEESKNVKKSTRRGAKSSPSSAEDEASTETKRPNVLLIDEPEICLHPSAVREACKTLYDLAETDTNWQVIVTTHSPVFIDISRNNTTIVRVQREETGEITSTTIFRPKQVQLSIEDQESLKLLNLWDPYVAEFFFGGRTILVEGDTEYSVFKALLDAHPDKFSGVHIIRARGKAILLPLIKILNHFGHSYSVLHDADTPKATRKTGEAVNAMWTENQKIKDAVDRSQTKVRLVASIKDFETALFGEESKKNKPYSAWKKLTDSDEYKAKGLQLLEALFDHQKSLPNGFLEWDTLPNLQLAVEALGKEPS